jgi:hypothetical protein
MAIECGRARSMSTWDIGSADLFEAGYSSVAAMVPVPDRTDNPKHASEPLKRSLVRGYGRHAMISARRTRTSFFDISAI